MEHPAYPENHNVPNVPHTVRFLVLIEASIWPQTILKYKHMNKDYLSVLLKVKCTVQLDSPYMISYQCLIVSGLTRFLYKICLQNLSDVDFDFSRSLKVKLDSPHIMSY